MKIEPLKFAYLIRFAVEHFYDSWGEAAKACHMPTDRLIKIGMGQNQPLGADTLRIVQGLPLKKVKPEHLEERGLP